MAQAARKQALKELGQRIPQAFERRPDREDEEQGHVGREHHSQMAFRHHALALYEHHRRVYTFALRKHHMYIVLLLLLLLLLTATAATTAGMLQNLSFKNTLFT